MAFSSMTAAFKRPTRAPMLKVMTEHGKRYVLMPAGSGEPKELKVAAPANR